MPSIKLTTLLFDEEGDNNGEEGKEVDVMGINHAKDSCCVE